MAHNQPAKLAALEGHFQTGVADLYLFGVPRFGRRPSSTAVAVPGGLSFLVHEDFNAAVPGLDQFAPEESARTCRWSSRLIT